MLFVFKWQNGTRHKQTASGRASSHFPRHLSSLSLVQNIAVDICFVNSDSKPEGADYFSSTYCRASNKRKLGSAPLQYLGISFEKILQWTWSRFELKYKVDGMFCIPYQLAVSTNLPAAHCSSSAPFSQSRSPSHRHDNETHLLVAPPQSNLSGGHVCRPVWGVFFFREGGSDETRRGEGGRRQQMKKLEESKRTGENEGGGEQDERVRRKRGKDREREGTASQWNCLIT